MCPEEDGGCGGGGGGGGVVGTGGSEAAVALDELRSWWEVPAIAHFCSLFRTAFRLPDFEIEVRAPRPPSPRTLRAPPGTPPAGLASARGLPLPGGSRASRWGGGHPPSPTHTPPYPHTHPR